MKTKLLAATMLALASTAASAAVVSFTSPLGWADGTFTHNISGSFPDGFYQLNGPASAYNAYGQYGLQIIFNTPVTLKSLSLGRCSACFDSHPTAFSASLTDSATMALGTKYAADGPLTTLTFNTAGVKAITFGFYGNSGNPYPGDARSVAWYEVADVTYNAVPEPASWALFVAGFGLVGAVARRRTRAVAAA